MGDFDYSVDPVDDAYEYRPEQQHRIRSSQPQQQQQQHRYSRPGKFRPADNLALEGRHMNMARTDEGVNGRPAPAGQRNTRKGAPRPRSSLRLGMEGQHSHHKDNDNINRREPAVAMAARTERVRGGRGADNLRMEGRMNLEVSDNINRR